MRIVETNSPLSRSGKNKYLSVVVGLFLPVVLGLGLAGGALADKREAKKEAAEGDAAAQAGAENSIEGAWWIVFNDGNTYGKPRFIVTRKVDHFEVKSYANETVRDIQATKTTLKFAIYYGGEPLSSYDLYCQGKFLVGTGTHTIRGTRYTDRARMVRKPWKGAL